jgi:GT2 family glycosyltransferase
LIAPPEPLPSPRPERVAIVIPAYNRKATTLACLEGLEKNGDLARCQAIVVDDGSSDGTAEAIGDRFPGVTVLRGDGSLWWTGATARGMQHAIESGADFVIWLNDDTFVEPGAVARLVDLACAAPRLIPAAQTVDPETGAPSNGGVVVSRRHRLVHVRAGPGERRSCDGLSGNFLCVRKEVVEAIGYPDARRFPQYYGDHTYTFAAKRAGFRLELRGDIRPWCRYDHDQGWLATRRGALELLKDRFRVKSSNYWRAEYAYYKTMLGPPGGVVYLIDRVLKFGLLVALVAVVPRRLRLALRPAGRAIREFIRRGGAARPVRGAG